MSFSMPFISRPLFLSTPSGWRATTGRLVFWFVGIKFLSTPSGWRATALCTPGTKDNIYFYPRPPGGGRRRFTFSLPKPSTNFYPRPPGGGRLVGFTALWFALKISIHALRVEGDQTGVYARFDCLISIHALRVEGDDADGGR